MRVRDQHNCATGILDLAFGVSVAVAASHYRIGSLGRLGPEYFPFAAGMALGLVGFCLIGPVPLLEENFRRALICAESDFTVFVREPISLALLALAALVAAGAGVGHLRKGPQLG